MGQAVDQLASTRQLDASLAVRPRKAVGSCNPAVHSYSSIDGAIVHAIATRHLGDFTNFAAWIEAQEQ